jgi:hypothetical protein
MWQCISHLQVLRKPIIQLGRRSCTNLIVYVTPMKHEIIGGQKRAHYIRVNNLKLRRGYLGVAHLAVTRVATHPF